MGKKLNSISNTFCIQPWVSLYMSPAGGIYPCCLVDTQDTPAGDVLIESLTSIRAGENMKEIRRKMVAGETVSLCKNCTHQDQTKGYSFRNDYNEGADDSIADKILPSGELNGIDIDYIDFRFSNLCNLECRTCGSELSSKIGNGHRGYHPVRKQELMDRALLSAGGVIAIENAKSNFFMTDIVPILDTVKTIYTAGGEPLMHVENYKILEYLIEKELFNKSLIYSTNLSTLKYKDFDYVSAWEKFQYVNVFCSIDYFDEGLSYIRQGANPNQIFKNLRRLVDHPTIMVRIATVVSIYNIYNMCDFVEYLHVNNYVNKGVDDIGLMTVLGDHDTPLMLPSWAKDELISKINADLQKEFMQELLNKFPNLSKYFTGLLTWVTESCPVSFSVFVERTEGDDKEYNTKLENVFPWLYGVVQRYKHENNL